MIVIRPIRSDDAEAFYDLAFQAGIGMTSMPKNRAILHARLESSLASFAKKSVPEPRDEYYLFVLEDISMGKIGGICSIWAQTARESPLFFFRIENKEKRRDARQTTKKISTMNVVRYRNYWSEIASLFLHPAYRQEGNGRLLALSRFLFIAEHPQRFSQKIFAEMRGHIINNSSPFWEGIGAHFFKADFASLMQKRNKGDVDLTQMLPAYPLYIELLPPQVQASIGSVHKNTAPALQMLLNEGFKISAEIDICDGGPKLEAEIQNIRTVKESRIGTIVDVNDRPSSTQRFLLANRAIDFRACQGPLLIEETGELVINSDIAGALQVTIGDTLRFAPLNISDKKTGDVT